jgi:hypothetical protein
MYESTLQVSTRKTGLTREKHLNNNELQLQKHQLFAPAKHSQKPYAYRCRAVDRAQPLSPLAARLTKLTCSKR